MNSMVLLTKALEPFIYSTLRHWVGWLGGIMVGVGMISTGDQKTQFTGLALALGMWFWSVVEKIAAIGPKAELDNLRAALRSIAPPASIDPLVIPTASPIFNRGASDDMQVSPVMNKVTLVLLVLMCLAIGTIQVYAADVASAPKATAAPVAGCPAGSNALCNGGYLSVNLGTGGVSSDVSSAGINSSSFTAGGLAGAGAGWQYWYNNWFAGIDAKIDYDTFGTVGGSPGLVTTETIRLGGWLSNVFAGPTAAGQGPTQIGPFTGVIPFVSAGPAQKWLLGSGVASGWAAGTGFAIPLGGRFTATAEYLHYGFNKTVSPVLVLNSADTIMLGINYHIGP